MHDLLLIASLAIPQKPPAIPPRPEQLQYPELSFTPPKPSEFRSTLPDGTPLYLAPSHELPLIHLVITAKGGSNLDPEGRVGLGGMTSDLLRTGGTESMAPAELDEALDFLATDISVKVGGTSSSATMNCLASNFDQSLGIFMDILRRPRFDGERLALAVADQLEQMKQRNDDAAPILSREWANLLYGEDHFQARQPVAAGIEAITAEEMRQATAAIFHPGNFIVTVSGDFDPDAMRQKLAAAFAGWEAGARAADPEAPTQVLGPGLYHVEKDIPQGKVAIGMRSIGRDDPDFYAYTLLNDILGGGGFTSRIMSRVRSDEGLAYSAGSKFDTSPYYPGAFQAGFESKNATVALAIKIIMEEFERIRTEPVSAEELKRAKASMIETFPRNFASKKTTLGILAGDELSNRPADYWEKYRERIAAVTAEDILRVAQSRLKPDEMAILVVGKWDEIAPGDITGRAKMELFGPVQHLPLRDPLTLEPIPGE